MTTAVQIIMPKPNHKRAKVQSINPETGQVYSEDILEHGTVSETVYVHDGSKIVVTEVD